MTSARTRAIPLMVLMSGALLGFWLFSDSLTFDALRENRSWLVQQTREWPVAAVVIYLLCYIAIVSFSLPGATVATLTGGFLFGIFPGVLYNVFSATSGATILFLTVKAGFGDRLAARMQVSEGKIGRIRKGIDNNQWAMLFLIRLLPTVPFFVANLLPAFLGVPLYRFVISTALGIVPGTLAFTYIGAGLGAVFDTGGSPDLSILRDPRIAGALALLVVLVIAPVLVKALKKRS